MAKQLPHSRCGTRIAQTHTSIQNFVTSQINIVKDIGVIEKCLRADLHYILGMLQALWDTADQQLLQHRLSSFRAPLHLRQAAKAEIVCWIRNLHQVNGQPFKREDIHRVLDIDMNTDASQRGWGAVLYLPNPTAAPDPILLNAAWRALPSGPLA